MAGEDGGDVGSQAVTEDHMLSGLKSRNLPLADRESQHEMTGKAWAWSVSECVLESQTSFDLYPDHLTLCSCSLTAFPVSVFMWYFTSSGV